MTVLWVFLGGGLGAVSRFGISKWLGEQSEVFPYATFVSNLIATLILGLVVYYAPHKVSNEGVKLFLLTGFCGGFSTFSTFSYETFQLLQTNWLLGILNILLSVVGGLGVLWLVYQR